MSLIAFKEMLERHHVALTRKAISTVQVNIGKRCNQACHHCHVEAGPNRTENMDEKTITRLLSLILADDGIKTVDVTGGAPELNPHFRSFIAALSKAGKQVIDRCNLTVLFEPGQEDTAEFLAKHHVEITASLPCYLEDNVDAQRGKGVFDKSILALQQLNQLGYGKEKTLNLVYNPVGYHLPPAQQQLEQQYKEKLYDAFGIHFTQLFTITNMPIKRFLHALMRDGEYERYMQLLIEHFNPSAAENVMCRELISISWDGKIYDCDFNQMLSLPIKNAISIWDIERLDEVPDRIALANHCYGCTAGAGSSCGGALAK